MKKSLFSLSLRKPDSSLYSDLFPPNSEFARNSAGNEISADYFIGWFSIDCQSDLFRQSQPSKLRKTVRFAIKYCHLLRMPSAEKASAKQKRERKTKYFQQKNLRKIKTLRKVRRRVTIEALIRCFKKLLKDVLLFFRYRYFANQGKLASLIKFFHHMLLPLRSAVDFFLFMCISYLSAYRSSY